MRFKHLIFFDFGLLVQSLLKKFFFLFQNQFQIQVGAATNSSKNRRQATQIWNKKKLKYLKQISIVFKLKQILSKNVKCVRSTMIAAQSYTSMFLDEGKGLEKAQVGQVSLGKFTKRTTYSSLKLLNVCKNFYKNLPIFIIVSQHISNFYSTNTIY